MFLCGSNTACHYFNVQRLEVFMEKKSNKWHSPMTVCVTEGVTACIDHLSTVLMDFSKYLTSLNEPLPGRRHVAVLY